jgi:hypothetical protein
MKAVQRPGSTVAVGDTVDFTRDHDRTGPAAGRQCVGDRARAKVSAAADLSAIIPLT